MTSIKRVIVVTDGSCLGNPGPGGWAYVIRFGDHKREAWGCEIQTTNNRMELMAAIRGLRALKEPCEVALTLDSEYVKNGITKWIAGWKKNGWKTAAKKDVLNKDLWQQLEAEVNRHKMQWEWTKGHADHEDNNRCDELAQRAAREQCTNE